MQNPYGNWYTITEAAPKATEVVVVDEAVVTEAAAVAQQSFRASLQTKEGQDEMRALFDRLDKNKDGRVDAREFIKVIRKEPEVFDRYFGQDVAELGVGAAFRQLDQDDSNAITWEEFSTAFSPPEKAETATEVAPKATEVVVVDEAAAAVAETATEMAAEATKEVTAEATEEQQQ
jgi:hypothetical protein